MSKPIPVAPLPFEPDGVKYFSQKQIAESRGVSRRTVIRDIRRYKIPVHNFVGIMPVFTADAVELLESKRKKSIAARNGHILEDERDGGAAIVSLKELRAVKRRNGKARR